MPIFIYNSLSHKKEELIPLNPGVVNIYTCGVTVYDECHIGHARSLYIFDVLRRYLEYSKYKVNFVRNITDIDDKIINRANDLKINWETLVTEQIEGYKDILSLLNIRQGILDGKEEPRATKNIPDIIKYIEELINKNYAYVTDSGVYFSVRKFKEYGKLSGQGIDQMQSGARIDPDEHKQDPLDFALWKTSKPDEPFWESPWGRGRPGWHIECSVMSQKYTNSQTLDIHAGGRDLIFPHHENEIAQAEAATGEPFAKYWIHHGLLTINGQKMAKSLGNFVTVKDFIAKYKYADILKLFFLSAHYSKPIDYNQKEIEAARQALERISIMMKGQTASSSSHRQSGEKNTEIEVLKSKFIKAMDDDFNMPQGLAVIFDLVTLINKNIDNIEFIENGRRIMRELLDILGISLKLDIDFADKKRIEDKIAQRNKARQEKNYDLADKIRKELEAEGIILEDTSFGTMPRRKL